MKITPRRLAHLLSCVVVLGAISLPLRAEMNIDQAMTEARTALDSARKSGAERDAADDLATARSWMGQAEKLYETAKSLLGRVVTPAAKKEREQEIVHLATMARIKADIAETRARKTALAGKIADEQKKLAEIQSLVDFTRSKIAEAEKARTVKSQADLELARVEDEKRKLAEREKQAAIDQAEKDRLNAMQAKLKAVELENSAMRIAGQIPRSTVRNDGKQIVVTIQAADLFPRGNDLGSNGKESLDGVAEMISVLAGKPVTVSAFHDDKGKPPVTLGITEKRAQAVADYLKAKATGGPAITAAGRGDEAPVASNASEQGRNQNRRVEIAVSLGN